MRERSVLQPALLGLLLCWLVSAPLELLASEIYTWVDEHGVTHFTDQRPSAQRHEVIRTEALESLVIDNPRPAQPPPPARPSAAEQTRAAAAASRARRQRAEAEERLAAQCQATRDQLEQIQARLRAGYGVTEGNRLRQQRRELRSRLHSDC